MERSISPTSCWWMLPSMTRRPPLPLLCSQTCLRSFYLSLSAAVPCKNGNDAAVPCKITSKSSLTKFYRSCPSPSPSPSRALPCPALRAATPTTLATVRRSLSVGWPPPAPATTKTLRELLDAGVGELLHARVGEVLDAGAEYCRLPPGGAAPPSGRAVPPPLLNS
jgi:hypothetical protein